MYKIFHVKKRRWKRDSNNVTNENSNHDGTKQKINGDATKETSNDEGTEESNVMLFHGA